MHTQVFFSSHLTHITFFIFITFSTSQAQDDEQFSECRNHTYSCGQNVQSIGYPFWGNGRPQFCGHPQFELKCQNNDYPIIVIDTHTFRVLDINQSMHTMTMARSDLWNESDDHCPQTFRNITLNNNTLFGYAPTVRNLNIYYGCIPNVTISKYNLTLAGVQSSFSCEVDGFRESGGFYADESFSRIQLENCTSCEIGIEVPILRTSLDGLWNGSVKLQEALNLGFEVVYNADNFECSICEASDGICGSDSTSNQFVCLCRDQPYSQVCRNHATKFNLGLKLGIGFGAAGVSILLMCLIFFFYQRRNKNHYAPSSLVSRNISSYTSSMRDLEKESTCFGVQMFSYGELEEATNNFDSKEELGDGGFGTVYKGKLRDGRVVAVKRLYENNYKRVEQFLNEVEILTRLRHQNLVSLYGCTSRHCRELLLVYEYIPNGTVADHLHGERAKPGSLAWSTRMSIAIETASALTYLHASDIIHRDVKTTNILLDNNFSVKVADFGLSRLFPIDVTHISTAPQGTPGYVDPEYHECYHLTDKSDVYSFGVVLAELISSKPAVDITRHRHEINLSNLAINKIKNQELHELVDPCIGFESDYEVRKMITDVAELVFQCLQSEREMRPSMQEVLEALQRIQSEGCDVKKAEEVDIPADVVLLKSDSATLSPDSVTAKWISRSTTPNASG